MHRILGIIQWLFGYSFADFETCVSVIPITPKLWPSGTCYLMAWSLVSDSFVETPVHQNGYLAVRALFLALPTRKCSQKRTQQQCVLYFLCFPYVKYCGPQVWLLKPLDTWYHYNQIPSWCQSAWGVTPALPLTFCTNLGSYLFGLISIPLVWNPDALIPPNPFRLMMQISSQPGFFLGLLATLNRVFTLFPWALSLLDREWLRDGWESDMRGPKKSPAVKACHRCFMLPSGGEQRVCLWIKHMYACMWSSGIYLFKLTCLT